MRQIQIVICMNWMQAYHFVNISAVFRLIFVPSVGIWVPEMDDRSVLVFLLPLLGPPFPRRTSETWHPWQCRRTKYHFATITDNCSQSICSCFVCLKFHNSDSRLLFFKHKLKRNHLRPTACSTAPWTFCPYSLGKCTYYLLFENQISFVVVVRECWRIFRCFKCCKRVTVYFRQVRVLRGSAPNLTV